MLASTLASTPTQTAITVPTNTSTPLPSATPLPSSTPTKLPSPTATKPPSATPTRLMPPSSTPIPIPVLLADEFNQPLDTNWETWGVPNLTPVITGSTQALLVNATNINSGGISSLNTQITLTPDLFISFTADVDYLDDQAAVLRFAWSPGTATPPEMTDELPLVLLIDSRQLTVQIIKEDGTPASCRYSLEDAAHTYRIDIGRDMLLTISVDGNRICSDVLAPLPQSSLPVGRIHFSGRGLIDSIYVSFIP